ncbi:hypothetical protein MRX96_007473 [Rhipicephalus microplus]
MQQDAPGAVERERRKNPGRADVQEEPSANLSTKCSGSSTRGASPRTVLCGGAAKRGLYRKLLRKRKKKNERDVSSSFLISTYTGAAVG